MPSDLTLSDLERSKSRCLIFLMLGDMHVIDISASNILACVTHLSVDGSFRCSTGISCCNSFSVFLCTTLVSVFCFSTFLSSAVMQC